MRGSRTSNSEGCALGVARQFAQSISTRRRSESMIRATWMLRPSGKSGGSSVMMATPRMRACWRSLYTHASMDGLNPSRMATLIDPFGVTGTAHAQRFGLASTVVTPSLPFRYRACTSGIRHERLNPS